MRNDKITVKQLIRMLKEMPQNMEIAIEVIDSRDGRAVCGEHSVDVFEGMNHMREECVVIQAFTE